MSEKAEPLELNYPCPYAETYSEISKFLKLGRSCKITGELCWNWYKFTAVKECRVKKGFEKLQEGLES